MRHRYRKNAVVPAKAGTQWLSPHEAGFPPSRERRYVWYYLVCVVSAAIAQLLVAAMTGLFYPTVGASGGVFGLLLAYAMYFPNNRIVLLFPPIPMPARVFVVLYAVLELYLGVTGTQEGVAHFAHLGGMVGGFVMLRYWRVMPGAWRRRF